MPTLKEKIIQESQRLGIDKIGFTHAEPFIELEDSLHEQRERGYNSGFEHQNVEERIYPEKTFEHPKSIISIALAYPTKAQGKMPRDEKRGQFARASWGIDYHHILQDRLQKLIAFIEEQAATEAEKEHWRFRPQVDTGEYVDTAVAQRAGLGFIGKNGLLITEEFGSFVYLGEVTTNIQFEPDEPVPNGCGDCTRCITGCPTGALLGDGRMNAQKCLSYQTQTKGMMPEEMEPKIEEVYPKLAPLLTISNKEFKQQFGHLASSWRGKKPLQRNALIALANLGGREAIPQIILCLNDQRPVIRGTAAWSLGQLAKREPEQSLEALNYLLSVETEAEVIEEAQKAIYLLTSKKGSRSTE